MTFPFRFLRPAGSAAALSALFVSFALTACGGGGDSGTPPIAVTFTTQAPPAMPIGATASIAALVVNDLSGGGVNWTVSCASASCGTLSSTSTGSGNPTVYTAPAAVPSPAVVTLTATSITDATRHASAAVTITPPAAPALADGTYVYHLSGQDSAGPYTVSGAFSVAGGTIRGGEQDYSDPNGGYTDSLVAATSSLSLAGSNLQIVLDTGNPAIGVNGVQTLRASAVSASRLLVTEFDISASGTGSIDLQSGTTTPDAGYAFAVSGTDTNGNPLSIGGVLDFDGGALSIAHSVFDASVFNTATNTAAAVRGQLFQSGSVTAPDAFGRVEITLTPSVASGVPEFVLAGYLVGSQRIQLVESAEAADALNANTGGTALGQGANTGGFNASSGSVLNQSYAHGSVGVDANGGAAMSGAYALGANGVLGGTLALNDGTNVGAWQLGGSYTVDATGRVTGSVTSLTSQTAAAPASAMTFQLYLDGSGNAMVIGADPFQSTQGIAFAQGGTFQLGGDYAVAAQGDLANGNGGIPWSAAGSAAVAGGNVAGTTDYNNSTTAPQAAVTLGGYQDATNGLLQLIGLNGLNFGAATAYGYYPLSGNRLWAIEVDRNGASLLLMEGKQP